MKMYSSDRLLYFGTGIGAIGIILISAKVGPFWVGGIITAASLALFAAHYLLGVIRFRSMSGGRLRQVVSVGAAALALVLLSGLLWASAVSAVNRPVSGDEKTVAKALPILGILFGVVVALDFVLADRED